jgi:hypothetical protein
VLPYFALFLSPAAFIRLSDARQPLDSLYPVLLRSKRQPRTVRVVWRRLTTFDFVVWVVLVVVVVFGTVLVVVGVAVVVGDVAVVVVTGAVVVVEVVLVVVVAPVVLLLVVCVVVVAAAPIAALNAAAEFGKLPSIRSCAPSGASKSK